MENREVQDGRKGANDGDGSRGGRSTWLLFVAFAAFNLIAGSLLAHRFLHGDRTFVVPGTMTRGHYPIERQCDVCHTAMLGVRSDACLKCHRDELDRADDSHPPRKFTDPRNADRLVKLDARNCIVCHVEHRPEITRAMGVTQPTEVCKDCHADVAKDRPSHKEFSFSTCQNVGCHNFHDNRTLNEEFLAKHLAEPSLRETPRVPAETRGTRDDRLSGPPLTAAEADAPESVGAASELVQDWAETAHAKAKVNCMDCHGDEGKAGGWTQRPDFTACRRCHDEETKGFLGGKHGMRLSVGLSPMTPALARLPMRADAAHRQVGCTSCHGAHRFDRQQAAVDACLGCHDDDHSRAYKSTKHFALWQAELAGTAPAGSGVSCATCHLPREVPLEGGFAFVRHNQNEFIRPDEKMVGAVCQACHGIGFAMDAIADAALIKRGVDGPPAVHVESLEMVRKRAPAAVASPPDAPE
jgi:hypothetical protein